MEKRVWRRFCQNHLAVIGLVLLFAIVLAAIFADALSPYSPSQQDLYHRLQAPSLNHLLGTDEYGRDIFARLLYGARVSLLVGFSSTIGAIFIGTVVGSIAGFYGKWIDGALMRFVDVINAFPSIFLLITIVTILRPSLTNIIFVFVVLGWTGTARLVRGEVLKLKGQEYIWAAQSIGVSNFRIIFYHILPNAIAPIIVSATIGIGSVILAESGLSFLGLGVQPPVASWGNMLQAAQNLSILIQAPWYPIFPGLMILVTVLSFNFVGDGLRDAMNG